MKSTRTIAKLSDSVHQHLNMYSLAAGAAGVSLLALAQPAEAKIVYTPASVDILPINLDLNGDGITDFTISRDVASAVAGNGVEWSNFLADAAALSTGARIGKNQNFGPRGLMIYSGPGGYKGNWQGGVRVATYAFTPPTLDLNSIFKERSTSDGHSCSW